MQDGICEPVRNVLYRTEWRGLAQNVNNGVTNPAAFQYRTTIGD